MQNIQKRCIEKISINFMKRILSLIITVLMISFSFKTMLLDIKAAEEASNILPIMVFTTKNNNGKEFVPFDLQLIAENKAQVLNSYGFENTYKSVCANDNSGIAGWSIYPPDDSRFGKIDFYESDIIDLAKYVDFNLLAESSEVGQEENEVLAGKKFLRLFPVWWEYWNLPENNQAKEWFSKSNPRYKDYAKTPGSDADNPWLIETAEELATLNILQGPVGQYAKIAPPSGEIDLGGKIWTPIDLIIPLPIESFDYNGKVIFIDGNNTKIKNLLVNHSVVSEIVMSESTNYEVFWDYSGFQDYRPENKPDNVVSWSACGFFGTIRGINVSNLEFVDPVISGSFTYPIAPSSPTLYPIHHSGVVAGTCLGSFIKEVKLINPKVVQNEFVSSIGGFCGHSGGYLAYLSGEIMGGNIMVNRVLIPVSADSYSSMHINIGSAAGSCYKTVIVNTQSSGVNIGIAAYGRFFYKGMCTIGGLVGLQTCTSVLSNSTSYVCVLNSYARNYLFTDINGYNHIPVLLAGGLAGYSHDTNVNCYADCDFGIRKSNQFFPSSQRADIGYLFGLADNYFSNRFANFEYFINNFCNVSPNITDINHLTEGPTPEDENNFEINNLYYNDKYRINSRTMPTYIPEKAVGFNMLTNSVRGEMKPISQNNLILSIADKLELTKSLNSNIPNMIEIIFKHHGTWDEELQGVSADVEREAWGKENISNWINLKETNDELPVLGDNTPPLLSEGKAVRTGLETAEVSFKIDKPGKYYYKISEENDLPPDIVYKYKGYERIISASARGKTAEESETNSILINEDEGFELSEDLSDTGETQMINLQNLPDSNSKKVYVVSEDEKQIDCISNLLEITVPEYTSEIFESSEESEESKEDFESEIYESLESSENDLEASNPTTGINRKKLQSIAILTFITVLSTGFALLLLKRKKELGFWN